MPALRICVSGAGGRMGRMLREAVKADQGTQLSAALTHAQSPLVGTHDNGDLIVDDMAAALAGSDVLIDFTRPEGTLVQLAGCREAKVNAVVGTTGFTPEQKRTLEAAAQDIAIVFAPNMSVGVNVTLKLIELATRALHEQYDIEIIESHHRMKVDAPSGTALKMGEVAAMAMGKSLEEIGVYERYGLTGERKAGTIGFSTIRGGDIIGDHTVMYAGTGERIEISHKSSSRATYVQGAIRAAKFLADKRSGLFDMWDVLQLR